MGNRLRPSFITGWRFRWLELQLLFRLAQTAFRLYPRRSDAWQALRRQIAVHREYRRLCHLTKAVRVGERTIVQLSFPHVHSAAAEVLAINELLHRVPVNGRRPGLNKLFLAITKKCSLRCAHCYEWDALNGRERLSVGDVLGIIRKFQAEGVATVELTGGEPLNRFDDLLHILGTSDTRQSDFWVTTSGYRLTAARAGALKAAGLLGVAISLDHWDAAAHDAFRGLPGSFEWVRLAVQHAQAAGLAVCLELTALRAFCTPGHLWRYARLARAWGVHLIRILEPQAVGHFAGQDVLLRPAEIAALEAFVAEIQHNRACRDFPVVEYYAPHQRHAGCSGAGRRFMYVDTDGGMHACPFCRHTCGNAVEEPVAHGMRQMAQAGGCHLYSSV